MSKNSDFYILVALSIAIVLTLLLGAYTSPTFTQKMNYLNSIIYFGAVVFIASATLVLLWHGFKHFSIMLTLILGAIIFLFGIKAAIIATIMTYIVWGFAFSIELLLAHNGVKSAIEWFKKYYSVEMFKIEFAIFYPMLMLMYILLDVIPNIFYKDTTLKINKKELYEAMCNELKKNN